MNKFQFHITINNWAEHQKGLKKGHSHFLLSKRFFDDPKIALLKQNECLLFINLLCIGADMMSDSFVIHAKLLPNLLRIDGKSLENCLERLQSFQLVTIEKKTPFNTLNEMNIKDITLKETKEPRKSKAKKSVSDSPKPPGVNLLIARYCDNWKMLYKSADNPLILGKDAGLMTSLLRSAGHEKALRIIDTYFSMPDPWFITKRHDVPTLIANTNSIIQFAETGKLITRSEIQRLDKHMTQQNLRRDIEENGI